MSRRHKFSEIEVSMTPGRRARISRIAAKLDAEINAAQSSPKVDIDYRRLHELSEEFTLLWKRLQAFYLDSVVGFTFVRQHVEAEQAKARDFVSGTELDSIEFQDTRRFTYSGIFSDSFFARRASTKPLRGRSRQETLPMVPTS